jgi:hypothetical protein
LKFFRYSLKRYFVFIAFQCRGESDLIRTDCTNHGSIINPSISQSTVNIEGSVNFFGNYFVHSGFAEAAQPGSVYPGHDIAAVH